MAQFVYRLQLLLDQKEEARKEAEREVTRREQELQAQQEALRSLQQRERDLIENRAQLRRQLLKPETGGTVAGAQALKRSEDVQVVGLQIEDAKQEIAAQGKVVALCEARLEEAHKRVEEARREVEVLTKHRAKQEERFRRAEQVQEELALDEIGNVLHTVRRRSE